MLNGASHVPTPRPTTSCTSQVRPGSHTPQPNGALLRVDAVCDAVARVLPHTHTTRQDARHAHTMAAAHTARLASSSAGRPRAAFSASSCVTRRRALASNAWACQPPRSASSTSTFSARERACELHAIYGGRCARQMGAAWAPDRRAPDEQAPGGRAPDKCRWDNAPAHAAESVRARVQRDRVRKVAHACYRLQRGGSIRERGRRPPTPRMADTSRRACCNFCRHIAEDAKKQRRI